MSQGGCNHYDAEYAANNLQVYQGKFDLFVRNLENHIDHQHFRPQVFWIRYAGKPRSRDGGSVWKTIKQRLSFDAPWSGREGDVSILCDFVGRYETLAADVQKIAARIGIDGSNLPTLNRTPHDHYRTYYDTRTASLVADIYKDDIRAFDYQF